MASNTVLAIEKLQPMALDEQGTAAAIARVQQEVQGAIIIAKRFPRNEDECRAKLLKACRRPEFADDAEYSFPRGGSDVVGPSVYFAREAARLWGNIQYGFEVIRDDDEQRTIRCFAWDLETNARTIQEDSFGKLIYRKPKNGRGGEGQWITPDERDLRELTNRRAAIGYRNCILQLIPSDLVSESCELANKTLKSKASQDPDGERKRVVDAFAEINVMPSKLEEIIGHRLNEASPAEIAKLRGIYKSVKDGNSIINDYVQHNGGNGSSLPTDIKRASETTKETRPTDMNDLAQMNKNRSEILSLCEQINHFDEKRAQELLHTGSELKTRAEEAEFIEKLHVILHELRTAAEKQKQGGKATPPTKEQMGFDSIVRD